MIDRTLAINKIEKHIGLIDREEGDLAYAAVIAIVYQLRHGCEQSDPAGGKLNTLLWHINAAYGIADTKGHSTEKHIMWAREAIYSLAEIYKHQ